MLEIGRRFSAGCLRLRALIYAAVLAPLISLGAAATASAETPAEERAQSFEAVQGPQTEDVPGGVLLLAAYATVWLLLMLYVWQLGRRSRRIERQLAEMEQKLNLPF